MTRFRTYHQLTGADRSQLGAQVGAQRARVRERLRTVARVVAVMSGKGGVGKSYVSAALALGAADRLAATPSDGTTAPADGTTVPRIGVLDADLKSPTIASMLGARGPLRVAEDGVRPAAGAHGVAVASMELLLEDGRPLAWREPSSERFVWRGVLETGALRELLADVAWGALDLLVVDLPPGADALQDLVELVPDLTGAIAVTIPSEESRRSVERAMRMAADAKIPLLGVVENMSGYACGGCGETRPLFPGDAGATLAAEFSVPLLARIPFDANARSVLGRIPTAVVDAVLAT